MLAPSFLYGQVPWPFIQYRRRFLPFRLDDDHESSVFIILLPSLRPPLRVRAIISKIGTWRSVYFSRTFSGTSFRTSDCIHEVNVTLLSILICETRSDHRLRCDCHPHRPQRHVLHGTELEERNLAHKNGRDFAPKFGGIDIFNYRCAHKYVSWIIIDLKFIIQRKEQIDDYFFGEIEFFI